MCDTENIIHEKHGIGVRDDSGNCISMEHGARVSFVIDNYCTSLPVVNNTRHNKRDKNIKSYITTYISDLGGRKYNVDLYT